MRRVTSGLLAGAVAVALAGMPAAADDTWRPTPGGWVSGALDWVTTVPVDVGTAIDAVIHGDVMFVTSWRGFSTYDVSDPADPRLLHTELVGLHLINEQPQTNGEILLLSNDGWDRTLEIWDVSDPAAPKHVGRYLNPEPAATRDHLWACVHDCAYAYGSHGTILDLADPTAPKKVGNWRTSTGALRNYHHIAEVAPGLVLVGGLPVVYLDARETPTDPARLASFEPHSRPVAAPYVVVRGHSPSVPARVDWPLEAADRFVLVSMESPFSGDCRDTSATFGTYDAEDWEEKLAEGEEAFTLADEYGLDGNGLYHEGKAPLNFWGCSTYGFEVHPSYETNRLVGLTVMEQGIRVVSVSDEDGTIDEVGGFVPVAGSSSAARWVGEDVLYSIDLHRGIDVLRRTGGS